MRWREKSNKYFDIRKAVNKKHQSNNVCLFILFFDTLSKGANLGIFVARFILREYFLVLLETGTLFPTIIDCLHKIGGLQKYISRSLFVKRFLNRPFFIDQPSSLIELITKLAPIFFQQPQSSARASLAKRSYRQVQSDPRQKDSQLSTTSRDHSILLFLVKTSWKLVSTCSDGVRKQGSKK